MKQSKECFCKITIKYSANLVKNIPYNYKSLKINKLKKATANRVDSDQ